MKRLFLILMVGILLIGNVWAENSIIGSWNSGNSSETTIFYKNGFYIHYASGDDNDCYEGVEYGSYTYNDTAGKIIFSNMTDQNGTCGLASINDDNYTAIVSGDTLTLDIPSDGVFEFQRVISDSIVGSWTFDNEQPEPSVSNPFALTFYNDGHYILYNNDDGTDCVSGSEHGTYVYNNSDGTTIFNTIKGTNGMCGFAENTPRQTVIAGDTLTMTLSDGPVTFNRVTTPSTQSKPSAPTLLSPLNGSSDISLSPKLTTGSFSDSDAGETHLKTDWALSISSDFSDNVFNESSAQNLTELSIPSLICQEGTTYYWRVRFYDDKSAVSDWSNTFSFTTLQTQDDTTKNGIPDILENQTVDINNDGIADIQQTDVIKTLNTVIGNGQMGVSIKESSTVAAITQIDSMDPDDISTVARPEKMPLGLFSFRLATVNSGDTADITIHFSEAAPANTAWYIYNSVNGWTDYSQHATFSSDRNSVRVQLKDGDYGDSDGIANGIIVDPCGFGIASWIKGDVTDVATNQKVTSATIRFKTLNLNLNTLVNGNYVSMILPGEYDFVVSAPGYLSQTVSNVKVLEAGIVTKDVRLSPSLTKTQVSQLYASIFGRASEGEGNAYWCSNQDDMEKAADTMLATGAAKSYFGTTLNDNQKFIEFIYENTLGKTVIEDPEGVNYWVSELTNGKSKGAVIATLINAVMDAQYVGVPSQDQFINKVTVCNYTADTIAICPDANNLTAFVGFISAVTHDSATVTTAKAAVDAF